MRMDPPEAAEQPGNDLLGRGGDRGHAQFPPLGIGSGGRGEARLVEQPEDAVHVRRVLLARARQPQAPPVRPDQRHPDRPLQRRERGRHRGLRDHEPLSRSADGSGLGHGQERTELVQRQGR